MTYAVRVERSTWAHWTPLVAIAVFWMLSTQWSHSTAGTEKLYMTWLALTPSHLAVAIVCSASPEQWLPEVTLVAEDDLAPSPEQEAPPAHDVAARPRVRTATPRMVANRFMACLLAWVALVPVRLR